MTPAKDSSSEPRTRASPNIKYFESQANCRQAWGTCCPAISNAKRQEVTFNALRPPGDFNASSSRLV